MKDLFATNGTRSVRERFLFDVVARDQQNGHIRVNPPHRIGELKSIHVRHLIVGDQEIRRILSEKFERRQTVGKSHHFEIRTNPGNKIAGEREKIRIVVDQDTSRSRGHVGSSPKNRRWSKNPA
ncbi:MAG: hypothetical protein ABIO94_12190 [Opitutaceae bacterium]